MERDILLTLLLQLFYSEFSEHLTERKQGMSLERVLYGCRFKGEVCPNYK